LGNFLEQKRKNEGWQFGEGYSVGCGSHLNKLQNVEELTKIPPQVLKCQFNLKRTPKLAPWITGKPNVLSKALTKKGVKRDSVKECTEFFFEEPRKNIKTIFTPPHVLIREVVDGTAIPAIFSSDELVFSNQIIGVHAPQHDENELRKLVTLLNDSGFFGFLALVVSSRMLVSRATSILQDDIFALPYPKEGKVCELSNWEMALVEDIIDFIVEFRSKGETAAVLSKADESDLHSFGEMYCDILNPVYKQFRPLKPIQMGKGSFICYPFCYGDTPQIEFPKEEAVIPYLDELLHRRHGSRLFINRILRIYEQNVIFMIKPNQKRYWLRSIALRDADETLIDLLEQGY
jgi:hypothetical protein